MRTFVFALLVLIVSAVNGQSDKDNYSLGVTVRFKYGRMVDSHMVTKTFYNSELNPTRSIGYDKKGSKVSEWKYEYKDNRLVKKIFTSKKYGREVTEYIYNDQGNEVQEKKYSRGKLSSATKSEYHNSKLIKRQDFAGKDSLTGQLYMTYDDNGNRIKQIYVDAKADTGCIY